MSESTQLNRLLIVDDEADILEGLRRLLSITAPDLEVVAAQGPQAALNLIAKEPFDVVLLDIRMPGMDGLELIGHILKADQWLTIVMMTAYASIETAVEAIRRGAYDFITKPLDTDTLLRTVKKALERNRLIRENMHLQQKVCERSAFESFVGRSAPMRKLYDRIQAVARASYTVLVRGQSGTGKELVARAIHGLSPRRSRKQVAVNCPAIPEHLLESELFGHRKGAFTGANTDHEGVFDEADGGTLLLDEIGDIPVPIQAKLLRVLQEQEIRPLGSNRTHKVDVRIVASTNQDLESMIRDHTFREDLFYRLNVVTIRTPSLDETREDIPLLVGHFVKTACCELGISPKRFSTMALEECMRRPWPGNVRELQNFVRRAVIFCPDGVIRPDDLHAMEGRLSSATDMDDDACERNVLEPYMVAKERTIKRFTLKYVSELLDCTGGNVTKAAELSGLRRSALQKIMRRLQTGD